MQEIINGISKKLKELFPEVTIYQDDVKQDLKEPCFFIIPLIMMRLQLPMGRHRMVFPIQLTYLPKRAGSNTELLDVAEQLLLGLKLIELEDDSSLLGWNFVSEIVNGTLQFTVNFNYHLVTTDNKDKIETLEGVIFDG